MRHQVDAIEEDPGKKSTPDTKSPAPWVVTIGADRRFHYHDGRRIRFVRPSANPLFESAARVFDGHTIAVVLSGGGSDATDGVQDVKAKVGTVIAQDECTSEHWHMPRSAIESGAVDHVPPVEAIGPMLDDIVHGRAAAGAGLS